MGCVVYIYVTSAGYLASEFNIKFLCRQDSRIVCIVSVTDAVQTTLARSGQFGCDSEACMSQFVFWIFEYEKIGLHIMKYTCECRSKDMIYRSFSVYLAATSAMRKNPASSSKLSLNQALRAHLKAINLGDLKPSPPQYLPPLRFRPLTHGTEH